MGGSLLHSNILANHLDSLCVGELHSTRVRTLDEKVVETGGGFHTQLSLDEVPNWLQAMVHMLDMHDNPKCLNL